MEEKKELYEKRQKRLQDVIDLKQPDVVPVNYLVQGYPVNSQGHTMAEAVYDFKIAQKCVLDFAAQYDLDIMVLQNENYWGLGEALELMQSTRLDWAGKPGGKNKDTYIHQIHEITTLQDEEFDYFNKDFSGWMLHCGLPRVSKLLEPLASIYSFEDGPSYDIQYLVSEFSTPGFKKMMRTIWEIDEICASVKEKLAKLDDALNAQGCLTPMKACAWVPFDCYGAYLRGTEDAMMDLYENEETILKFCDRSLESQLNLIQAQGRQFPGKWCVFYLTKASDQFMGAEHFQKYYWKYLQRMIEETVKVGMVPYVYTEGAFNNRLEFLKDVPKGTIYHFESMVDMERAKRILGKNACIAGGFPIGELLFGTPESVTEKTKRLLDTCMPDGGYIFEAEAGYDEAKRENVDALFETVRQFGRY